MNYFQIINTITKKSFSPIYLLYGDEPYFINKICDVLRKNVIAEENKSFDEKIIYAEKSIDMNNLLCDLKSYPITGESQLIIIKNAENLSKIDNLETYFSNPQISTVLVLCLNKDWKSIKTLKAKKWFKILNNNFSWNKPLILIQGMKDNIVKPDTPEKIVKKIKGNQIQIILLKNSDHRLSEDFDLKVINDSIFSMI